MGTDQIRADAVRTGKVADDAVSAAFNEGMSFESFVSTMPGSIYAGPVWR